MAHTFSIVARDPHNGQLGVAVTLADSGELEKALPIFVRVFKINPDWAETVQRLPKAGFLRDDQELIQKILTY